VEDPEHAPPVSGTLPDTSTVAGGFGLGLLLQLIQIPLAPLIIPGIFIALSQVIYIVPAIVMARRRGYRARIKGLTIAACVVALINVACWGILLSNGLDFR
jgi:hypothetical protein